MESLESNAPMQVRRDLDLQQEVIKSLQDAAHAIDLDSRWLDILATPQRVIEANLPLRREDGSVEIIRAYRCQHNNALGPYKGGIRFHPGVTRPLVEGLASTMTWKNALVHLPFGGAKGGAVVDATRLTPGEHEDLARTMTRAFRRILHPERDVPAPDLGTTQQTMDWIKDEYETTTGRAAPAIVTGKSPAHGGLAERSSSTGRGVITVAQRALARQSSQLDGSTVAIQGFGKVGMHAAITAGHRGATIVGLADASGTLYKESGLPIERLAKYAQENNGLIDGFDGMQADEPDAILESQCDVLIPAALENQIHQRNAHDVQAKLVVEGANGPTTPEGARILAERGIPVMPDILANAGGVILSFFEWQQGMHPEMPPEGHPLDWMDRRLSTATDRVFDRAIQLDISPRIAAYSLALERVAARMQEKYPGLVR